MRATELLPILQQAFPAVSSYTVLSDVVQANAEGHRLKLIYDEASDDLDRIDQVFVKQVVSKNYLGKTWPDFRRTMMYLRTETRFYNEVLPQLQYSEASDDSAKEKHRINVPKIYFAQYNLNGLVTEEERATDPAGDEPSRDCERGQGGVLVMEAVDTTGTYFQDSPLSVADAKRTLTAIAKLHAAAWEQKDLLEMAYQRLSRGSYHLATRNPKELANMREAWDHFYAHVIVPNAAECGFPDLPVRTETLGARLQDLAQYISDATSPLPSDRFATLSHGDYKSMNCFLPRKDDPEADVILVDFASTGVGLGMSDVAMHLHHAIRPKDLEKDNTEMALLDHYLGVLDAELGRPAYPTRDDALKDYRLAVCDYARFFLGRFWKTATTDSFEKKKDSKNTSLINRDLMAALAFCDRVDRYLSVIEQEKAGVENNEL